jgi:hypothetical protein
MLRSVRCALAMTLLFALAGCASNDKTGNTGGKAGNQGGSAGNQGGSGGSKDGSAGTEADTGNVTPDALSGPPKTCREVRVCIHGCGDDKACADKCVSTAPTAIRQQYQEIQACSMSACPTQEEACKCEQECFNMGQCFDLVDACDEGVSDPWCDVRCH